jgi:hypothetical protein
VIQEKLELSEVKALFPGAFEAINLESDRPWINPKFYLTDNGRLKREILNLSRLIAVSKIWNVVTKKWDRTTIDHGGLE